MPSQGRSGWLKALDAVASLFLLVLALLLVWPAIERMRIKPKPFPLPTAPVSLGEMPVKGSNAATIGLIEFADYQCPYCARFDKETLPSIVAAYIRPGRLIFAFRNLPLTKLHPLAAKAAEAAVCANKEGKLWEMHDEMYRDQKHLELADLLKAAKTIGLNESSFANCLSTGGAAEEIQVDVTDARTLGIAATPFFLIGTVQPDGRSLKVTHVIPGQANFKTFQIALDAAMQPEPSRLFLGLPLWEVALGIIVIGGLVLLTVRVAKGRRSRAAS